MQKQIIRLKCIPDQFQVTRCNYIRFSFYGSAGVQNSGKACQINFHLDFNCFSQFLMPKVSD